jgi:hypothetical protein
MNIAPLGDLGDIANHDMWLQARTGIWITNKEDLGLSGPGFEPFRRGGELRNRTIARAAAWSAKSPRRAPNDFLHSFRIHPRSGQVDKLLCGVVQRAPAPSSGHVHIERALVGRRSELRA